MKAILSLALVLGFCNAVNAADDKQVGFIGTWNCEYKIDGMKRSSTMTIKKDGDKLAGTMSWPNQKETELKNLKSSGDTLTFSAERKLMDNVFQVEYKFAIDGDKLKGEGAIESGGQKRTFAITGARK